MYLTDKIIPYVGTESIALYQSINDVRQFFTNLGVKFQEDVWGSSSESVPNPWTVITIDDVMSLFFAKHGKLFKIVLWKDYQGSLPNGIHARMQLKDAQQIDPELAYDDWNEDYESPAGYWLEDDIDTGEISSISIFIKEVLDEDNFDHCDW